MAAMTGPWRLVQVDPAEPVQQVRADRYAGRYHVAREHMCELAPMAFQELVRDLVRQGSPDWSTVRIEVQPGIGNTWDIRLSADAVPRPGGARRG